jgi:eukaryotic-like serine/threonine-protein kinase
MPNRNDQKLPSTADSQNRDLQETADYPTQDEPEDDAIRSTLPHVGLSPDETPGISREFNERFELMRELGRGGMGIVYLARDRELSRDLAIKLLHDRYQTDSTLARRFLEEASISSQLQHPGIPPVFDVGKTEAGRPYLAMKRIKGKTLAEILDARSDVKLDHPKYVAIFEQVCQTLAYVHSKKVIHRDLKPANIMVGAFGEVQVMDWGLAKVINPAGPKLPTTHVAPMMTEGTVIESNRDGQAELQTLAGSLLGTLSYMPPEQATGQVETLDSRSDVFSLGGILKEILTGELVYLGSASEVRAKATLGFTEEAFARLDASNAEPELVELAKHCLAKDPKDRPAHAGEVAHRLIAHREAVELRLQQAELERAKAETQAVEQRRRRQVQLALFSVFACLIAIFVVVLAGSIWFREEALKTNERVLDRVDGYLEKNQIDDAFSFLERAETRLRITSTQEQLDRYELYLRQAKLSRVLNDLEDLAFRVADKRMKLEEAIEACRKAFLEGEMNLEADSIESIVNEIQTSREPKRLIGILDVWLSLTPKNARIGELLEKVDPDPFRSSVRKNWMEGNLSEMAKKLQSQPTAEMAPQFASLWIPQSQMDFRDQTRILREYWNRDPTRFDIIYSLARAYHSETPNRYHEAIEFYRAALVLRPQNLAVHVDLALALVSLARFEEAIDSYTKAISIDSHVAIVWANFASVYLRKHEPKIAIKHFEHALTLDRNSAYIWSNLGIAYWQLGDWQKSLEAYQKAASLEPSVEWRQGYVNDMKRYLALEAVGEKLRKENGKPKDDLEAFQLAEMHLIKGQFVEAFHYYEQIKQRPKIEKADVQYDMTCQVGQGVQGRLESWNRLTPEQKEKFLTWADEWLRDEYRIRKNRNGDNLDEFKSDLQFWMHDRDLMPFRSPIERRTMPPNIRESMTQFWNELEDFVHSK